jgi:hypothetical protein
LADPWRMFLSRPAGSGRGPDEPSAVLRGSNCPHGSVNVLLRKHGTSFHPWRGYSGDAAIPEAASLRGETTAPPRGRTVSPCLWVRVARRRPGRRGTFTGQCGQPLCSGDATSHRVGPQQRTAVCAARGDGGPSSPRLRQARERGLPTRPKRDTSRATLAWPLRRRPLPDDAGCVPSRRGGSSKSFRTGAAPPG